MSFEVEGPITPVSIGDIRVTINDSLDVQDSASAAVQIIMSDGSERRRSVPLQQVVSQQTITQLQTMMANLRTKANEEIL